MSNHAGDGASTNPASVADPAESLEAIGTPDVADGAELVTPEAAGPIVEALIGVLQDPRLLAVALGAIVILFFGLAFMLFFQSSIRQFPFSR